MKAKYTIINLFIWTLIFLRTSLKILYFCLSESNFCLKTSSTPLFSKNSIAEFVAREKMTTEIIPERWDLVGPEVPADLYTHAGRRSKHEEEKTSWRFSASFFCCRQPFNRNGSFFRSSRVAAADNIIEHSKCRSKTFFWANYRCMRAGPALSKPALSPTRKFLARMHL